MPLRYPERLIDTCIAMYKTDTIGRNFGRKADFLEIDWIYCMTRASRQTPYRFDECCQLLEDFADGYLGWFETIDWGKR